MAMLGQEIPRNQKSPNRRKNLSELFLVYSIYSDKILHGF
ncbi:hypothetical protein DAT1711_15900 [Enterococcus cecorum]